MEWFSAQSQANKILCRYLSFPLDTNPSFIPVTGTRKEKTKEASEWFSAQTQANKIPCRYLSFSLDCR